MYQTSDYNSQFTMNKRAAAAERVRCVFCNSLSHKMEKCNSNFNGRRKELDEGWDFLIHEFEPRFELFTVNELRYIAWNYGCYEGAIHDWREKTTQQYNRKFKYRPIDIALPKPLLIKELCRRWKNFQPVRDLAKNKPEPTEEDDCPICLECTPTIYEWSHNNANWIKIKIGQIKTECKHSFCIECWDNHIQRNHHYDYGANHHSRHDMFVNCPMCRHQIKVK